MALNRLKRKRRGKRFGEGIKEGKEKIQFDNGKEERMKKIEADTTEAAR